MSWLQPLAVVVHVLLAFGIIALVLLQRGRGADAGAGFGAGASGTVFGARGSASFLSRTTAALATLFFLSSLGLSYLFSHGAVPTSVMDRVATEQTQPGDGLRDDWCTRGAGGEMCRLRLQRMLLPCRQPLARLFRLPRPRSGSDRCLRTNECGCGGIGRHAILRG